MATRAGGAGYRVLVPGDLLDAILIVLAAAFAVAGYRQGFLIGLLSFVGFLGGAAVGAMLAPRLVLLIGAPGERSLAAIVIVFLAAVIGQLVAAAVGGVVRSRVTWHPAAVADSLGGATVSVASVLLVAWLIGSAVAVAPHSAVAGEVKRSVVLRGVGMLMPPAANQVFYGFRQLLGGGPAPVFIGALGPDVGLTVAPPARSLARSPAVAGARPSVVQVTGAAPACGEDLQGSGFVISRQHVLTNAHVVAGVTEGLQVHVAGGAAFAARVVLFDPQRDVAVLYVRGLTAPPLRFAASAAPKAADAIVLGYPLNGPFLATPARVAVEETGKTRDIYGRRIVSRQIYALRTTVIPGNSGGPLISPSGLVYGVVFAEAIGTNTHTGYALSAQEVAPDARRGAASASTAANPGCAAS